MEYSIASVHYLSITLYHIAPAPAVGPPSVATQLYPSRSSYVTMGHGIRLTTECDTVGM